MRQTTRKAVWAFGANVPRLYLWVNWYKCISLLFFYSNYCPYALSNRLKEKNGRYLNTTFEMKPLRKQNILSELNLKQILEQKTNSAKCLPTNK